MKSGNPALSQQTFQQAGHAMPVTVTMTVSGTMNKPGLLFLILLFAAAISWSQPSSLLIWGGAIGGFIVAMVTIFKKEWSSITAPIYAGLEGLFLGGLSLQYAADYDGVEFNAVLITNGGFAAVLFAVRPGLLEDTQRLGYGVVGAAG